MHTVWAQRREEVVSDCLVSPDICQQMVDRLAEFVGPEPHVLETEAGQRQVHRYLAGRLSHLHRKHAEERAMLVDVERQVSPACSGPGPWDQRPLVTVCVGQVADRLAEPAGLIAFDPRRFPQRGTHSVGVKRQWCGHRGKVDNCQVGVCRGYVSRYDHALRDFRLSLPEDWAQDEPRRQACHVPLEVRCQPRQEQCLERLATWGQQGPPGWVTGDEERGRHTRGRHALRERGERYVLGVPCPTTMRDREAPVPAYAGRGRPLKAPGPSGTQGRQALPGEAWVPGTVRDGEKGPVAIALVRRRGQTRLERKRTGPAEWLVVTRRPRTDDGTWASRASRDATEQDERSRDPAYLTPTAGCAGAFQEPSLGELARVIKAGACMEASCKRGKGEAGMDASQVRTWQGWHPHLAFSLLAVWFLRGATHRGQPWTPALTLPQVRYGLSVLRLEVCCTSGMDALCRLVQRQLLRNELARFSHHRTRKCLPPRKLRREIP